MHQQQNLFKLRADSMSVAHQWSCAAAVLATMAFLLILISAAMPDFTTEIDGRPCDDLLESQRRGVFCNKVNFNAATVFQTYAMDIDAYSQTLYVKATPMKAYVSQPALVKTNISYQLMIDEVRDDLLVTRTFKRIDQAAAAITCDFRNSSDQTCGEFMLFALPQIDPGNYRVSIQVHDMMEKGKLVSSMKLQAYVVNPKYYAVFLGVRYTFFAISLTTAIFFLISYARIPAAKRVFEQHALAFMLVILALFNDPLAYLNVVKPSRFSVFVSIFCIAIFVTYVLFFWLVLFERVHRENGQQTCKTMQWWKIAYSAVFGIFFIAAMCIAGYLFLDDPTFYRASQSAAYNGTFAIAAIMVALAFIYLSLNGYFIICAWSKLIQRNKLLFLYSAAFVVAMAGLLWGSAFNYYNSRGPTLLLAVVVCNLYTFLLVYVLLPLPQSSEEVMRYFRNAEINAGVNNQYGSLPQVTEEELFTFKPEESLGRPKRLIGTDDKPGAGQRSQDDSNDYTLEDDDTDRKKHASTSLQDKPTLSPQEPMSGSNVKQKDGDSFTFN